MNKNFFIGEGPEAEALIAEVKERREAVGKARNAVQKEYGADGLLSRGEGREICGLAFKEQRALPFLKGEVRLENGFGYYAKKNCKEGKELSAKLRAPELQFCPSDHIIHELKLNRMCVGAGSAGIALYSSAAGFAGNKILVSIPCGESNDPMPEVPTWFRAVKESEWLAAQGK